MDAKISQPLLEEKTYQFQEGKQIDEVEHIELRDADPTPAVTETATLQVTTEAGNTSVETKKRCKFTSSNQPCQPFSIGLNVLDRDENNINGQVHILFDDVIAEPDGSHSFESIWRGDYVVFHYTKLWTYRLFATIVGWPLSFVYGLLFALFTVCNNFLFTPIFKLFALLFFWIGQVWGTTFHTLADPVFESLGKCFGNIRFLRGEAPATGNASTNTCNEKHPGANGDIIAP